MGLNSKTKTGRLAKHDLLLLVRVKEPNTRLWLREMQKIKNKWCYIRKFSQGEKKCKLKTRKR